MINQNPYVFANRLAQLAHLAKGRFYWGIGVGLFPGDLESLGFDPVEGNHRTMTREALKTILEIWNDPGPGDYTN